MADRTVSVALRADVSGYIAKMRAAAAATKRLGDEAERAGQRSGAAAEQMGGGANRLEGQIRELAEAERRQTTETRRSSDEMDRHRDSTDRDTQSVVRNRRATEQSTRGLTANRRTLVSLIAAGVAAGAAVTSAGVALGAFGVIAAGSIVPVITAQKDMAERWGLLTGRQQVAATSVRDLTEDYKRLARSYEPESLAVFNQLVGTTRVLLPQLGDLFDATSGDVGRFFDRFGEFINGRFGNEFLGWAGQNAPEALDVLGDTMFTVGDTALDLIQDIAPLGIELLQLTNGALGLLNGLASLNPALAQLAVSALIFRAPVKGIIDGLGNMTTRTRTAAAATDGMSKSSRALSVITAAGPSLYVAAGVALGFFAVKALTAKDSTDRLIDSLRRTREASGNNLNLYRQQADFLANQYAAANRNTAASLGTLNDSTYGVTTSVEKLHAESEKAWRQFVTMRDNADHLAGQMGVTRTEALRLADAAGVNLALNVDKAGKLTQQAADKIRMYQDAVRLSNSPTNTLSLALADAANKALVFKNRLDGLKTALQAQLNPTLDAFNATTKLMQGFKSLGESLDKGKASFDRNNTASISLRKTFSDNIEQARNLHTAIFEKTRSLDTANAAVRRYIPVLYAAAGGNREAREAVQALANTTGFQIGRTEVSRKTFITQATAMVGSRTRAEELWTAYRKLQNQTGANTSATGQYITRIRQQASEAFRLQVRTGGVDGAQNAYNATVRRALPVLYALAGRNKDARAQVDQLARSVGVVTGRTNTSRDAFVTMASKMGIARERAERLWKELQKIKSKDVRVDVNAQGHWRMPGGLPGPGPFGRRAAGGPIPRAWALGSGGPTADDVPLWGSVDEHMVTAKEVEAAGGHQAVYRIRRAMLRGEMKGFASGGPIGLGRAGSTAAAVGGVTRPVFAGQSQMIAGMAEAFALAWKKYAQSGGAALSWARSQAGKPYVWGGVGPGGYDCSGFMSAIVNVIRRRNPHSRLFTTHAFRGPFSAPAGFVQGLRSPFQVGVTHAGVGHMAGTLGGVNVESGGGPQGSRVYVGAGASGARDFPQQYGLRMARGGAVTDRLGQRALKFPSDRDAVALAATLGLIGDPSSPISPARPAIPGYAGGGWVRGRAGSDRVALRATAGEFMVNRVSASANGPLLEAVNAGLGEALLRRTIRGGLTRGGDGATAGRGGTAAHLTVVVHNHGVIGNQLDMDNWLIKSLDRANRQGRLPAALTR